MFPLSDDIKHKSFPLVTLLIIFLNVGIFLYSFLAGGNFVSIWGLVPAQIEFSDPSTLLPFLSSQFLHGGFFHIISNMWFLWIFGNNVEDRLGKVAFLIFYLFCGVAAALLQYFFNTSSAVPMIGASGAVSGVLGAYYVFFPHAKIKSLLIFFFMITVAQIPATAYIFYWFVIQIISGIVSIPALFSGTGGVAFWAHVGGLVAGYGVARLLGVEKDFIEGEIVD